MTKKITGIAIALLLAGCSGTPDREKNQDEKKPGVDPGNLPAGAPDQTPTKRKPTPESPGHPPDDKGPGAGGGGGGGNLLEDLHKDLTLQDKEKKGVAEHY